MVKGRPRIPKEVHQAKGTYQASRHDGISPKQFGSLVPPEDLSPNCDRLWRSFVGHLDNIGLNNSVDEHALTMLVVAFDQWQQATKMIMLEGMVLTRHTKEGSVQYQHPAVSIQDKCFKQVHNLLREFGLTPVARTNPNLLQDPDDIPYIMDLLSPKTN